MLNSSEHFTQLCGSGEVLSPSPQDHRLRLSHRVFCWALLSLILWKSACQEANGASKMQGKIYDNAPKPKKTRNLLNWSDTVTIWELWQAACWPALRKNAPSIFPTLCILSVHVIPRQPSAGNLWVPKFCSSALASQCILGDHFHEFTENVYLPSHNLLGCFTTSSRFLYLLGFFSSLFSPVFNTRGWIQGLMLGRQVLNHLSHSAGPLYVGYFWDRGSL
jgi:hypothetical protein